MMRYLPLVALIVLAAPAMAQKSRLQKAQKMLERGKLEKAESHLRKAELHPDTKDLPETARLREQIEFMNLLRQESAVTRQELSAIRTYHDVATELWNKGYSDSTYLLSHIHYAYTRAHQRGAELFSIREYDSALSTFNLCTELSRLKGEMDTLALFNSALCHERMGALDSAMNIFMQCLDMDYRPEQVYTMILLAYQKIGDEDSFNRIYREARLRFPSNFNLLAFEVNPYIRNSQYSEAIEVMEAQAHSFKENGEFQYTLGTLYYELGEVDMAKTCYLDAINLDPQHFDANFNYGAMVFNEGVDIYQAQGQESTTESEALFTKALPYLEAAHAARPEDQWATRALMQLYKLLDRTEDLERLYRTPGKD